MTIWKRWIQHGVLCGVLLGGLAGCSMVGNPPVGQIAQNDHAALAAWYEKEAANLRQKSKDMEEMAQKYQKDPQLAHIEGKFPPKADFVQHCNALSGMYSKAADEADGLARKHRSMSK